MKTLKLLFASFILAHGLHAQKFEDVLLKTYQDFERTDTLQQKVSLCNRFEIIAVKWSSEWTAHYYNAYAHVVLSYLVSDEKQRDALIDQAGKALAKSKSIYGKESDEILVMEAYVANARLSVKPMSRHREYGAIFDSNLEAAAKLNPQNPRIYFLKGQSTFYTPKAFGGGTRKALPLFEKAAPLFEAAPKGNLSQPFWGQDRNTYYIQECKTKS